MELIIPSTAKKREIFRKTLYISKNKKHFKTKKHTEMMGKEKPAQEPLIKQEQIKSEFKCVNCVKQYKTQSGLWKHAQICKVIPISTDSSNLSNEIKELKNIITEMVLNQQPTTINNNNNTNYINI